MPEQVVPAQAKRGLERGTESNAGPSTALSAGTLNSGRDDGGCGGCERCEGEENVPTVSLAERGAPVHPVRFDNPQKDKVKRPTLDFVKDGAPSGFS
jgi:hypothetical protein